MGVNGSTSVNEVYRAAVETELERIVNSAPFKSSKRSARLLTFVVQRVLEGKTDELKERTLGIELFGRDLDYNTSEDATVRVAAGEVRKRLAQFYLEHGAGKVRIDLPAGSYVPVFHFTSQPADMRRGLGRRWRWLAAGMAVVVAVALLSLAWFAPAQKAPDPVAEFWAPVLASRGNIVIAVGEVDTWNLNPAARDLYKSLRDSGCPDGTPRCRMPMEGIERIPVGMVPRSDLNAVAALLSLFHQRGRTVQIMGSGGTRFTDLKGQTAVLVGAGSNRWVERIRGRFRFGYKRLPEIRYGILDTLDSSTPIWALEHRWPNVLRNSADYGLLARWWDEDSGSFTVCLAGISPLGTEAAGELATKPELLRKALAGKPVDFSKRTVQIVFRAGIVEGSVGRSEVLAVHAE